MPPHLGKLNCRPAQLQQQQQQWHLLAVVVLMSLASAAPAVTALAAAAGVDAAQPAKSLRFILANKHTLDITATYLKVLCLYIDCFVVMYFGLASSQRQRCFFVMLEEDAIKQVPQIHWTHLNRTTVFMYTSQHFTRHKEYKLSLTPALDVPAARNHQMPQTIPSKNTQK